jgi:hypothetical protein
MEEVNIRHSLTRNNLLSATQHLPHDEIGHTQT